VGTGGGIEDIVDTWQSNYMKHTRWQLLSIERHERRNQSKIN